jgi:hypothetical protein
MIIANVKEPNSLIDITRELRVRITITVDIEVRTNIMRANIVAATMKKDPKSIRRSKIRRIIPREF